MTQLLRVLAALPKGPGTVPSTHGYTSSSRRSNTSSDLWQALHTHGTHTDKQTHIHTHQQINFKTDKKIIEKEQLTLELSK